MSLISWISGTTPQSEQEAGLARGRALYEQRLQARIDAGTIDIERAEADRRYISTVYLDDTNAAYGEGFAEGAQEGFQNVLAAPGKAVGFVGDSAGSLLGGILKNVPWWVYVVAAAYVFFSLGGLRLLKRKLAL